MAKTLFLSDASDIEKASLERRARIQTAILDCNADAIVVGDESGVVYANPAARSLLGEGLTAGWFVQLADGAPCPDERMPMVRAIRGEPFDNEEYRFRRPGSPELWLSVSGRRLVDEGRARGGVVTLRDVTEKKALERRLLLADRMASIGTLAAGIAHEIKNPLTILLGNLALALEALETKKATSPQDLPRQLEAARRNGQRVERIVSDLGTLSSGSDARAPLDLQKVISSALAVASKTIEARAALVRRLEAVPPVYGNEPRLGQVVLNLLVNAAQAIPEGARDRHEVRISLFREGDRVVLEVGDTGCGIPAEVLPRIFEPFFTTKRAGEGTGLGLWITQGIVVSTGGEISVTSAPGRTVFRVAFPAADGAQT